MIKQADSDYRPLELEKSVQEFWTRAKVYGKTVASREKGKDYYFCNPGCKAKFDQNPQQYVKK